MSDNPAVQTLILPCTCAGCCTILKMDVWPEDDKWPVFAEFYRTWQPRGLWNRLKYAYYMLRGREGWHDCIPLDEKEMRQLHDFLAKVLA